MSARDGVQLTVNRPVDGGESPNRYVPFVSAHVRIYWPPGTDRDIIEDVAKQALYDALEEARLLT